MLPANKVFFRILATSLFHLILYMYLFIYLFIYVFCCCCCFCYCFVDFSVIDICFYEKQTKSLVFYFKIKKGSKKTNSLKDQCYQKFK